MPSRPRFDPQRLRQLLREHPDWSQRDLAMQLSREAGVEITLGALHSWISRHREWLGIEPARVEHDAVIPDHWKPVASEHHNHWYFQMLRVHNRIQHGHDVTARQIHDHDKWMARMRDEHLVVDYDRDIGPYLREARVGEGQGQQFPYNVVSRENEDNLVQFD